MLGLDRREKIECVLWSLFVLTFYARWAFGRMSENFHPGGRFHSKPEDRWNEIKQIDEPRKDVRTAEINCAGQETQSLSYFKTNNDQV